MFDNELDEKKFEESMEEDKDSTIVIENEIEEEASEELEPALVENVDSDLAKAQQVEIQEESDSQEECSGSCTGSKNETEGDGSCNG